MNIAYLSCYLGDLQPLFAVCCHFPGRDLMHLLFNLSVGSSHFEIFCKWCFNTCFILETFRFIEKFQDSTESSRIPFTQFSLLLTSSVAMVHLSLPRNQPWYLNVNCTPDFIQISLDFPPMSFLCPRIPHCL